MLAIVALQNFHLKSMLAVIAVQSIQAQRRLVEKERDAHIARHDRAKLLGSDAAAGRHIAGEI